MDWYLLLKFLHVAAAVIWVGGGLTMVLLGTRADRAGDDKALVDVVRQVAWVADHVFVPASVATLVFGVGAAWHAGLWSQLWIHLGFAGMIATIVLGMFVLTPIAKSADSAFKENGATPDVVAKSRSIITIAKFDTTMLFAVIAIMAIKPGWSEWYVLALCAAAIAGAAFLWLLPAMRNGRQPA